MRNSSGPDVFVPEGLNDSSLAVYCLGRIDKAFRPVRDGMIGRRGSCYAKSSRTESDQIEPSLRDGLIFLDPFQAVNCQATIDLSLRDKGNLALGSV
jgi:hypothetical protein